MLKKLTLILMFFVSTISFADINCLYIDQKDQRFYDLGLIPKQSTSSLCGPVSYLNLILSDFNDQNALDSQKANQLLIETINVSRELKNQENIDVNKGLLEYELVKYIEQFQKSITLETHTETNNRSFKNYGESFYSIKLSKKQFADKAHEQEKQIWFLKLQEQKIQSPYSPKNPHRKFEDGQIPGMPNPDEAPVRIFHFISKIKTLKDNTFEMIDPENPNNKLILELSYEIDPLTKTEIKILKSLTPSAFKNFGLRPPYKIELKSIIAP